MKQIIFIHGIMGSVLNYRGEQKEEKVWPVLLTENMKNRYGILKDLTKSNIIPKEIEPLSYRKLTNSLKSLVSSDSDLYTEFVYDWRKNNLEHLEGLHKTLDEEASEIIIVAHSMGGIIARLMLNKYKDSPIVSKITKLITLGTPWKGSLDSVKTLKFGKQIPKWFPFALSKRESKEIARFFPSIYQILPLEDYFPVAKDRLGEYCSCLDLKGLKIENFEDLYINYIKEDFEHKDIKHDYTTVFEDYYSLLREELPPNIEHHEIIGVGKCTITSIKIDPTDEPSAEMYDGDGTVPLFSAYSNTASKQYFVNKAEHVNITKRSSVHSLIKKIINNEDFTENKEIFSSLKSKYYKKFTGKVIKIACPVEVTVLNDSGEAIYGKLNSIDEEIFQLMQQPENLVYEELGTTKYLIVDEDEDTENISYENEREKISVNQIKIQATDIGPTSVAIDDYENGNIKKNQSFRTFEINTEKEAILSLDTNNIENNVLYLKTKDGSEPVSNVIIDSEDQEEIILPQTSLNILNEDKYILQAENLEDLYVLKEDLSISINSVTIGSQSLDQTFIQHSDRLYILSNEEITIPLQEGLNEIFYFSKDITGNFEERNTLRVYKTPKKIYELNLEFLPHKYIANVKYNVNYENLLYDYNLLDNHKINLDIIPHNDILGDWIPYKGIERSLKITYLDIFNKKTEDVYIIDESTISNLLEGRVEKEEFIDFLNKLKSSDIKVKMEIGNRFRQRKLSTENLRNAKLISFENDNVIVNIRKYTNYELCWNNLNEEIDLDNNEQLDLQFSILDKDNKEVRSLPLNYYYTFNIGENERYNEDKSVSFNENYSISIDLSELRTHREEIDYFEIIIYEINSGNNIRNQKILIRK